LTRLSPGCYRAYAIARQIGDQYHLNDTATSTFEILPQQSVSLRSVPIDQLLIIVDNASPNPFTNSSSIGYKLKTNAIVSIRIFDAAGRNIRSYEQQLNAGEHSYRVNLTGHSAGAYNCEIRATEAHGSSSRVTSLLVHSDR
jgi:hypothetical protein